MWDEYTLDSPVLFQDIYPIKYLHKYKITEDIYWYIIYNKKINSNH